VALAAIKAQLEQWVENGLATTWFKPLICRIRVPGRPEL
jgi:hypothetical protein